MAQQLLAAIDNGEAHIFMKSLMLCYILQVAIAVKIAPVGRKNASASTRSIEKSDLESISFSGIVVVIKTELQQRQ